jgi:threonine dehydrogenase-like Zn-dependent dehydrogenase
MRAAVLHGPTDLRVEETAAPVAEGDQVTARVLANGLCGSDLSAWKAGRGQPVILGHEIAAEVLTGDHAGRVAVISQTNCCRACPLCLDGLDHYCRSAPGLGAVRFGGVFGGLGELVTCPPDRVLLPPADVDPAVMTLAEPFAVAVRALDRPEVRAARHLVVLGCGPVGLMSVVAARLAGVDRIIAVESRPGRAQLAARLGADLVLDPADDIPRALEQVSPVGVDVVVEAAGVLPTIETAWRIVRPGGTVILQGLPKDPFPFDVQRWALKEVTVATSIGQSLEQHQNALDAIATRADIPFDAFVTRRVPLDDAPQAFADLAAGADEIKIVVETSR